MHRCRRREKGLTQVATHGWAVELCDAQRVRRLLESAGTDAPETGAASLLERLIAMLEERDALARASLSEEPIVWDRPAARRRLWRLVEPKAIWRARAPDSDVELVVAHGHGDVWVLAAPGASRRELKPEHLLGDYFSASRSEPYARADSALRRAIRDLGGGYVALASREPLEVDEQFRKDPAAALFDLGFGVEPEPAARFLSRVLHLYDLVEDFFDRPLPRRDPIAYGELVALWSRRPEDGRPAILMLLSVDDDPTQRLVVHLARAAAAAGYTLVPLFAQSKWGRSGITADQLTERLERAWSRATGPIAGLVVHYGAAFTSHPSEYRAALTAFQRRHPDAPLASEALLGERGGDVEGIRFHQPPELDFLLEQLGF